MQLTRFTDLGLQVLLYLSAEEIAAMEEQRALTRLTSLTVSTAMKASQTHIAKIVSCLSDLGIIQSSRGRTGGIELSGDAYDYSLKTIVRHLEGHRSLIDRKDPHASHPLALDRPFMNALGEAQLAFFEVLNEYTLRDIAPSPTSAIRVSRMLQEVTKNLQHKAAERRRQEKE